MPMVRRMDRSAVGAEMPMRLASIPQKMGVNLAGVYSKVAAKDDSAGAQPLVAAVKVLRKFGIEFGYLAAEEPCCGAILYYAGKHREFARNAQSAHQQLKSLGVKRVIKR